MNPMNVLDYIKQFHMDDYGCIVLEDAMSGGQAGREDSLHHAMMLKYFADRLGLQHPATSFVMPFHYIRDHAYLRHPLTQYSTSRDQILPLIAALSIVDSYYPVETLFKWVRNCEVEKEKWKKYSWLIKKFNHTPNGDVFQPHHNGMLQRLSYAYDGENPSFLGKILLGARDVFLLGNTLVTLFRKERNSSDVVMSTLVCHHAKEFFPTMFSRAAYNLLIAYGEPVKHARSYFNIMTGNPPICEIIEEAIND